MNNSWCIVTGYFSLNDKVNKPINFYREKSKFILQVDAPLIFFVDKENYLEFWKIRKEYNLLHRTLFIINSLQELPYYNYRDKVRENRKSNAWYNTNNRNTADYFLLVASKLYFLNESTKMNPFQNTHFIWIDLGIQYLKYMKDGIIEDNLQHFTDKFKVCYMEYHSEKFIKNYAEFYKMGQRGIAGGILSGSIHYIQIVNKLFDEKIRYVINNGYGHGEEQILLELEKDNAELFKIYYGTYDSILSNRVYIQNDVEHILKYFVEKCRYDGNHAYSNESCVRIENSINNDKLSIDSSWYLKYMDEFFISSWYLGKYKECIKLVEKVQEMIILDDGIRINFIKNIEHYRSNFDFIEPYLPSKKNIIISDENELLQYSLEEYRCFIYDNTDNVSNYLLTCNPVKRPINQNDTRFFQ